MFAYSSAASGTPRVNLISFRAFQVNFNPEFKIEKDIISSNFFTDLFRQIYLQSASEMEIPYLSIANLGIIVVGCFGNLLSLILFLKQTSSVNTLLAALSFVDMCLLLIAIPVFVMPHM